MAGQVAQSLMMLNDNNSPAAGIDRPRHSSNEYTNHQHQHNQSNNKTNNSNSSHHGVVQQAYFERKALLERSPSIAQLTGFPPSDVAHTPTNTTINYDESRVGVDSTKSKKIMIRRMSLSSGSSAPFQQIQKSNCNINTNNSTASSIDSRATIKQQQHVIDTLRTSHEKQAEIIAELQKQLSVANQTATAAGNSRAVNESGKNRSIQSIKVHKPMRITTTAQSERSDDEGDDFDNDDERWHDAKSPPRHSNNSNIQNNMKLPATISMPVSPTNLRRIKNNNNNTRGGFQGFDEKEDYHKDGGIAKDFRIGSPPQSMTSSQQRRRRQSLPWSMPPRNRESMLGEGMMGLGMSDSASNGGDEGSNDELLVECVECGKWVKASSHGDGIAVGYCCSSVLVSALSDGGDMSD